MVYYKLSQDWLSNIYHLKDLKRLSKIALDYATTEFKILTLIYVLRTIGTLLPREFYRNLE